MDFGSEHVFAPKTQADAQEEVYEEELELGIKASAMLVEEEDAPATAAPSTGAPTPAAPPQPAGQQPPAAPAKKAVFKRKVDFASGKSKQSHRAEIDTNVVSVRLSSLTDGTPIHTGDVLACTGCGALFSMLSKIEAGLWVCEFCAISNPCELMKEEMPTEQVIDYIVEPAPAAEVIADEINVLFCVDVSGSMCVTTQIEGRHAFRASGTFANLAREFGDGSHQHFPGQRRDVSYVSR